MVFLFSCISSIVVLGWYSWYVSSDSVGLSCGSLLFSVCCISVIFVLFRCVVGWYFGCVWFGSYYSIIVVWYNGVMCIILIIMVVIVVGFDVFSNCFSQVMGLVGR